MAAPFAHPAAMGRRCAGIDEVEFRLQRAGQGELAAARLQLDPAFDRDARAFGPANRRLDDIAGAIAQRPAIGIVLRLRSAAKCHERAKHAEKSKKRAYLRHVL